MVERPIKKSERLANAASETGNGDAQPSGQRENRSSQGRDRKGKGKRGDRREEDARPPQNPALIRGPRPPKAQEVVAEEAPAEVDAPLADPSETTDGESAEVLAETVEAVAAEA